jgi:hypothetical protein
MPLTGSIASRIHQLHQEQRDGTASRKRSHKQIVAIAVATKNRGNKKRRK